MLNKYNKVIEIDINNFNCDTAYIPKNLSDTDIKYHIYNHDGIDYYAKIITELEDEDLLINELIGSYLSKIIGLDAVDYQIGINKLGKRGSKLYVLSKLFYEKDFDYKYVNKYNSNFFYEQLSKNFFLDNLPKDNKNLLDSILKLSLMDIKMIQFDRYVDTNIMIKSSKISNYVDLAPAYDFGFSYPLPTNWYHDAFILYTNYFLTVRTNYLGLKELLEKYPQGYETLYKLVNTDIKTVLKNIEEEKEIIIDSGIKEHIIAQDEAITKVLKRIL